MRVALHDVVMIRSADTRSVYAVQITGYMNDDVYTGVYWYDQSISTRVHFSEVIANMSGTIELLQLI